MARGRFGVGSGLGLTSLTLMLLSFFRPFLAGLRGVGIDDCTPGGRSGVQYSQTKTSLRVVPAIIFCSYAPESIKVERSLAWSQGAISLAGPLNGLV